MKMGINFSVGSILLVLGLIVLISVFPEKICVPFTSTCFYLYAVQYFKNTMTYLIAVAISLLVFIVPVVLVVRLLKYLKSNKALKELLKFMLTFDDKYYYSLKKAI